MILVLFWDRVHVAQVWVDRFLAWLFFDAEPLDRDRR